VTRGFPTAGLTLALAVAIASPAAAVERPPPIQSFDEAMAELSLGSDEQLVLAITNLELACRGPLQGVLRDNDALSQRLLDLIQSGGRPVQKAVFDALPCFSPKRFLNMVEAGLASRDGTVVAAAAEAAAHVPDALMMPPLLAALEKRLESCRGSSDLPKDALDACVWLAFSPASLMASSDAATRERAAKAATALLGSGHAKIRQVAVETLCTTGIKRYAADIDRLAAREEKKGFKEPNDVGATKRFRTCAQDLRRDGK
jgi:hypothetical protein